MLLHVNGLREVIKEKPDNGCAWSSCARKRFSAMLAHHAVRIFAVRQEQEPRLPAFAQSRQGRLQRTPGGLAPGRVAVKAEHDRSVARNSISSLSGGGGGAGCRHAVFESELRQRDDVHVALDHDDAVQSPAALARQVQAVQLPALVEQVRFR